MRDSYSNLAELNYEQYFKNQNGKQVHQQGSWGVALLHGNTGSKKYMGSVTAAFSYVYVPLLQKKRFSSTLRMGGGISWVQKPFNVNSNLKNIYIGSHFNTFTNFVWQNQLVISKKTAVITGIHFVHFSNGATKLPNKGMNIPGFTVGAKYIVATADAKNNRFPIYNTQKNNLTFFFSGSVRQAPDVGGPYFFIPVGAFEFSRRTHLNDQWCAGVISSFDGSRNLKSVFTGARIYKQGPLQIGAYGGYEFAFGKVSVPMQLGVYLYNQHASSVLFQHLGVRYRISKKFKAQLMMKTHTKIAEYLSWGIGYTF